MAVTTPDWLTMRDGQLRAGKEENSYSVYLSGNLQYVLVPVR